MLNEVVDAARNILDADRGTVFLYDSQSDELVVRVGPNSAAFAYPPTRA